MRSLRGSGSRVATGGGGGITEEQARDAVGAALTEGRDIDIAVSDPTDQITLKMQPSVATIASSATPTPNSDTTSHFTITALAEAATFGAPTGTPADGQRLLARIHDNGTARALAWDAVYVGADLPTITVVGKWLYVGLIRNSQSNTWDCIAVKLVP